VGDNNPLSLIVPFSIGAFAAICVIVALRRLARPRDRVDVVRGGFGRYFRRVGAVIG